MSALGLWAPLAPPRARSRAARPAARASRGEGGAGSGRPAVRGAKQTRPKPKPVAKPAQKGFIEDDNAETGRPKTEAERVLPKYAAELAKMRADAPTAPGGAPAPPSLADDAAFAARLAALKAAAPPPPSAAAAAASAPLATFDAPPPPPAPTPAADPEAPSGFSGPVKVIAVLCVVVYALAFGLEDILSGGAPAPGAPLSAASRAKLQKLVDDFAAEQAKAAPEVAVSKNALAAGQAAARLEEWDSAAAAFGAVLADADARPSDAGVALPARVDALIRGNRAADALAAVAAFEVSPAGSGAGLAASGLDGIDLRLLRAKALAARGDGAAAEALFEALTSEAPGDFRPLLAKGLYLRDQGPQRQLAADKALVQARLLAPKDARKMVDNLIGDR